MTALSGGLLSADVVFFQYSWFSMTLSKNGTRKGERGKQTAKSIYKARTHQTRPFCNLTVLDNNRNVQACGRLAKIVRGCQLKTCGKYGHVGCKRVPGTLRPVKIVTPAVHGRCQVLCRVVLNRQIRLFPCFRTVNAAGVNKCKRHSRGERLAPLAVQRFCVSCPEPKYAVVVTTPIMFQPEKGTPLGDFFFTGRTFWNADEQLFKHELKKGDQTDDISDENLAVHVLKGRIKLPFHHVPCVPDRYALIKTFTLPKYFQELQKLPPVTPKRPDKRHLPRYKIHTPEQKLRGVNSYGEPIYQTPRAFLLFFFGQDAFDDVWPRRIRVKVSDLMEKCREGKRTQEFFNECVAAFDFE